MPAYVRNGSVLGVFFRTCCFPKEVRKDRDKADLSRSLPIPDLLEALEADSREILSADPDALIVMVTSHGQRQVVIDAVEAGAKSYILKPFNQAKVEETIEKVREKYLNP